MNILLLLVFVTGILGMKAPNQCVSKGMIALVFSDGPVESTDSVLNTLQTEGISATFMFSTVNIDISGVADVIRKAVSEGHTVGLRTNPAYSFSSMCEQDIRDAITMELNVLDQVTQQRTEYISVNQPDVKDQTVLQIIDELGLILIDYNYDMYGTSTDCDEMMERWDLKLRSMLPQQTSYIVLGHDQRESELRLIPDVVEAGCSAGFVFVNMDQCLNGATMEGDPCPFSNTANVVIERTELPKKKSAAFSLDTLGWTVALLTL
ncbi:hypothetical protein NEOKW01_1114 [Nematocida sp. AWRm80]|nr:hypothetical protein NEOKW01_1114 [Nematocida sp. AWRm80]